MLITDVYYKNGQLWRILSFRLKILSSVIYPRAGLIKVTVNQAKNLHIVKETSRIKRSMVVFYYLTHRVSNSITYFYLLTLTLFLSVNSKLVQIFRQSFLWFIDLTRARVKLFSSRPSLFVFRDVSVKSFSNLL